MTANWLFLQIKINLAKICIMTIMWSWEML